MTVTGKAARGSALVKVVKGLAWEEGKGSGRGWEMSPGGTASSSHFQRYTWTRADSMLVHCDSYHRTVHTGLRKDHSEKLLLGWWRWW